MSLAGLLKTFEEEIEVGVTPDLKFIEKDKEGFSLKGYLSRQRSKLLRAKPPMKQGVTFSPSTITYNYCRRLKVAQLAGKTELYYEKAPPSKQTNFDLGNIIHELVQGWFWQIGVLRGNYYCIRCDKVYHDLVSPSECPSGKKTHGIKSLQYKELKISNKEFKISGRPDGILCIKDRDEEIVDIKSIAAKTLKTADMQFTFEDLETLGPKEEHVIQINLYMFCTNLHNSHLLYICKNDGRIKTFNVPFDYEVIKPYLTEIKHLVSLAEKWEKGTITMDELPPPCGRKDCNCEEFLTKT